MKSFVFLLLILTLPACMSTRVVLQENWDPTSPPSYVDFFDGYLLGFVGQPSVSLQKVCMDQKPLAFQRLKSADDIALTVVSLGIYSPTTMRVWCGD